MEGLEISAPILGYVAENAAPGGTFMVVDVGCSGGIHPVWRGFGKRLKALGVDPNISEIQRLQKAETQEGVEYLNAFAGIAPDHPFAIRKQGRGEWNRSPWNRLSVFKSQQIIEAKAAELTTDQKTAANLWDRVELANKTATVILPDYLRQRAIADFDFLKIDIDGKDFDVLNSFDEALKDFSVLGVGIEVNFFGSELDTDNTFHNIDRFLKSRGFELFNLSLRRYSTGDLPSKYTYHLPAATEFGRLLQGDAVYMRDLGAEMNEALARALGAQKLLNLVCLFACFNLPDCAAEVLVKYRDVIAPAASVDTLLDRLTAQAQPGVEQPLSYADWMNRFETEDRMFFREAAS